MYCMIDYFFMNEEFFYYVLHISLLFLPICMNCFIYIHGHYCEKLRHVYIFDIERKLPHKK